MAAPSRSTEPRSSLTLVIPAYNEARRLPDTLTRVLRYFQTQTFPWSVIVVDDGSTDDTVALCKAVADHEPRIRLIVNDHRGKAFAVRTGVMAADSDYVAFSDADLSVPIEQIERLLATLEAGYDVAFGSREGDGAERHNEPTYRHLVGRVYNFLYSGLLLPGIKDAQCGFKAFRTPVAHDLFRRMLVYGADAPRVRGGMVTGFDTELLFVAQRRGYRVKEVGVDWFYGKGTKVRLFSDSRRMFLDVFRIKANERAGKYDRELQA